MQPCQLHPKWTDCTNRFQGQDFRDESNPNLTGVIVEVPDKDQFRAMLDTKKGEKAMAEDGLKVETIRILSEFTP